MMKDDKTLLSKQAITKASTKAGVVCDNRHQGLSYKTVQNSRVHLTVWSIHPAFCV